MAADGPSDGASPAPTSTPYDAATPSPSAAPSEEGEEAQGMGPMSPTSRPSEIANGPSALPTVSSDGRYVAFESDANNLTNDDYNSNTDVFVRDMNTRVATRVSVNDVTGDTGSSYAPAIGANGRYVAFHSFSRLVWGDGNGTADIYLRDLQQGQTKLVSVTSSGGSGNGVSDHPQVTPDGRYVAFRSFANNLVANDNNGQPDIFVRDLQTNTTQRVSIAANGDEANGFTERRVSISSDGRYVAFESQSSNLVYGDNNGDWDVFVRDRVASTTSLISVGPGGFSANLGSYFPSMTPDGRYVTFHAWSSNLVPNDNNGLPDIFVRDRQTNTTTLVSQFGPGTQMNGISDMPTISADGRWVAFRSWSNNYSGGDYNGRPDVFLKDLVGGGMWMPSHGTSAGNGDSGSPVVVSGPAVPNGPATVFETDASNLVPGDTNGVRDIVLRDMARYKGVTVMPNTSPNASVSVSPTSGDRSTSFRATVTGSDPDGDPITFYEVSWGDGQKSFGSSPSHSYSGTGNFNVTAVVCDQFSACSNPSSPVTVNVAFSNRAPVASLAVSPSKGDLTTTFSANTHGSSDPDGDPLSSSIDWGDGTMTEGTSGQHQYGRPGTYEITGTVTDPHGEGGGRTQSVLVCGVSNADLCVGEIPRQPDPCDNATLCGPSKQVGRAVSDVVGVDPCDSAQAACTQVDKVVEVVDPVLPSLPLGFIKGAGSFTVVTANVAQASADGTGECQTNASSKRCNEELREKAFARRVKALAFKGTGTDGMRGTVPDIISLQEVREKDIRRPKGDHFVGILPTLNNQFPALNWKKAVALGDEDAKEEETTHHRTKDDTAILYASTNIDQRSADENKPEFIQTQYGTNEGCSGLGLDVDGDGIFGDCDKPTYKRHAVASFTRLNADGEKTEETIAVVSVHYVPADFLATNATLENLNPKRSRQKIYKEWSAKVALDLQSSSYFNDMDGYVLTGDFNAERCDRAPEDDSLREGVDCEPNHVRQPFWNKLRNELPGKKGPFIDTIFRNHGFYNKPEDRAHAQVELTRQYEDGDQKRHNRIDFIWVKGAESYDAASHDLTCGEPNCQNLTELDRYSDHRLVWSIFHL